jgi:hypothetical protein
MQKKKQKEYPKKEVELEKIFNALILADEKQKKELLKRVEKMRGKRVGVWTKKRIYELLSGIDEEEKLLCAFQILYAGTNRNNERLVLNILFANAKMISRKKKWEELFKILFQTIKNVGTILALRRLKIFTECIGKEIPDKGTLRLHTLKFVYCAGEFIHASLMNNHSLRNSDRRALEEINPAYW